MEIVNGCPICEGREIEDWFEKFCEQHNVCDDCGIKRKDVKGNGVWGTRKNFRCFPCEEKRKQKEIENFQEEHSEDDYQYSSNGAICPYCGDTDEPDCEISDFYSDGEYERECSNCGKKYMMETYVSYSYTTTKILGE